MQFSPAVQTIADTIQLSLSPVFMLAGIGALLNVLAGRLARVIDRARELERLHPSSTGPEHDRYVWELRILDERMRLSNMSTLLAVSSAIVTCTVVALLFVAELGRFHIGRYVAVMFIVAMAMLIASLLGFLLEVRASLRANRVRVELLERQDRRRGRRRRQRAPSSPAPASTGGR
jgi:uncharacterized membrane protein YciS (DUF1049 family)